MWYIQYVWFYFYLIYIIRTIRRINIISSKKAYRCIQQGGFHVASCGTMLRHGITQLHFQYIWHPAIPNGIPGTALSNILHANHARTLHSPTSATWLRSNWDGCMRLPSCLRRSMGWSGCRMWRSLRQRKKMTLMVMMTQLFDTHEKRGMKPDDAGKKC